MTLVGRRFRRSILLAVATVVAATGAAGAVRTDAPASATAPAVRLEPPVRRVTIVAGGDILTESRVRAPAAAHGEVTGRRFDFRPMFEPVAPTLRAADLAICNQELPISGPDGRVGFNGRSLFGGSRLLSPFELAADLAHAGFDRCSTATNHAMDDGLAGIQTTIEALDDAGISTVGTARFEAEAEVRLIDTGQAYVAHLSETRSLNDPAPTDRWRLNVRPTVADVIDDARRARALGAEVVVLSLHIGTELLTGPTPADRTFVTSIAASGLVDAVFIHGPHVVQPFEMVGSTAVWWSLGNFVSEMGPPSIGRYAAARTSDGLLAQVEFERSFEGVWTMTPTSIAICNDFVDRTVRRPTVELARGVADPRVESELAACLARTRAIVPDAR